MQHGVRLGHALERVLGIVGHADVGTHVARAGRGVLDAGEHLEQRRLARAVGADERHVVAAIEFEIDIAVDVFVAIALGDVVERDHHVARARGIGELEIDMLVALGQDHELALDLLDLAQTFLGLCGLGRLVAELVDEDLHVRDIALLRRALGSHLFQVVLALLEIARVVARVGRHAPVLERGNMIHAGVHEGAVVADDEHGALVARDETAQPLNALEIEVVRGLVEQKQVGMAQEELGERDAHLPAAGELRARSLEIGRFKAEAGEDLLGVALELVAPKMLKAILDAAVFLEKGIDALPRLGNLGDLELQFLCALAHGSDLAGRGHDLGEDARGRIEVRLLLEIAHLRVFGELHGAAVGRIDTHDELEHGGLAGAVGSDERKAVACVDLKRRSAEEHAGAEAFFDFVDEEYHEAASFSKKRTQLALGPQQFDGGDEGDRTPDLLTASQALSQLSYAPKAVITLKETMRRCKRDFEKDASSVSSRLMPVAR